MSDIKECIAALLLPEEEGLTWKELQIFLKDAYGLRAHHGSISGALNHLHAEGLVFSLKRKRANCKPYCHKSFRKLYEPSERNDSPSTTKWRAMADEMYIAMTTSVPHSPKWLEAVQKYEKMTNA